MKKLYEQKENRFIILKGNKYFLLDERKNKTSKIKLNQLLKHGYWKRIQE